MIQFKKLIVHNFGSYGHSELDLQNKGFCLVSGQNNYIKDNALSNGSGKSFLWSAICFALTGETINGIKNNLKNINNEETDCYVQLDFTYDKDFFSINRIISPKSDLKIFKNDIELSGKGIRESEKKLQEVLPELTKDLISSTIIIGQGMPNKFSSFNPSGRKELLEKLTKSDFMIEDLKTRITNRLQELSTKAREYEDSLLVNKSQMNSLLEKLETLKKSVQDSNRPDFDALINDVTDSIIELNGGVISSLELINVTEASIDSLNKRLLSVSEEKAKVSNEELTAYNNYFTQLSTEKTKFELTINNLISEIKRLQSIKDICPTCGQKLPNVHKPDTTEKETELAAVKEQLQKILIDINKCNEQHQEYVKQINTAFNSEIDQLNCELTNTKNTLIGIKQNHSQHTTLLEQAKARQSKLIYDKQNYDTFLKNRESEISLLEEEVSKITNLIAVTSLAKDDLDQRIAIVRKMDNLIRRDFRGFLLTNIISYLDNKAKDFCNTVFGTRELSLSLKGNALDITYCGKPFDGLSGGEKQRVDLILQLAIRELLTSYLGLSANILVLDEVTDFLDRKSCQAVMQLLEKELQTVESVFIISHHAEELEIPVDSEIRVIKNEQGISEIY